LESVVSRLELVVELTHFPMGLEPCDLHIRGFIVAQYLHGSQRILSS